MEQGGPASNLTLIMENKWGVSRIAEARCCFGVTVLFWNGLFHSNNPKSLGCARLPQWQDEKISLAFSHGSYSCRKVLPEQGHFVAHLHSVCDGKGPIVIRHLVLRPEEFNNNFLGQHKYYRTFYFLANFPKIKKEQTLSFSLAT